MMSMSYPLMKRSFAIVLVLSLLVVGGLASAQSVTHEFQHAHHQKATHGTVLCSWMCTAGQVLDTITSPALIERAPVSRSEQPARPDFTSDFSNTLTSRGPPNLSHL